MVISFNNNACNIETHFTAFQLRLACGRVSNRITFCTHVVQNAFQHVQAHPNKEKTLIFLSFKMCLNSFQRITAFKCISDKCAF